MGRNDLFSGRFDDRPSRIPLIFLPAKELAVATGQAEGIESVVTEHGAIEGLGSLGSGVPHRAVRGLGLDGANWSSDTGSEHGD